MFAFFKLLYILILSEFDLLKIKSPGIESYLLTVERIELMFDDIIEDYRLVLQPMDDKNPTIEYCNETISLKFVDQRYDGYEMHIEAKGYDKTSLGVLLGFYFDGFNYRNTFKAPNSMTLDQKVNFELITWRFHILKYWKMFLNNDTDEIEKFTTWQKENHDQILKHMALIRI